MIHGSDRKKKWWNSVVWRKKVMFEKNQGLWHRGEGKVEAGTLLLGSDKDNVITDKVLSYF